MTTSVDGFVPVHQQGVSADQSAALTALVAARSQESPSGVALAEKRVVTADLGLATALAGRYYNRGLEMDDLRQLAFLGLVRAVKRWDPEVGAEFVPYAYPVIIGEMKRYFRDNLSVIRMPRALQDLHAEAAVLRESIQQRLGRDATDAELASASGVDIDRIRAERTATFQRRTASLDEPAVFWRAASDPCGASAFELVHVENRMILARAMAELTERQRRLVELRYWQGMSQQQISDIIGISQMHVSRQLRAIQTKMRSWVQSEEVPETDLLPAVS
jgi:RNA polymerase sigma-B factor